MLQPSLGHAFADAALLDEVLFQATDLLIQQEVSLMNLSCLSRNWKNASGGLM